jgi:hypothetical protein
MSPGTPSGRSARGLFLLFLALRAAPVTAQVRPPARDTLAADTALAAQDTVLPPAVLFPAMPISGTASAADGLWIWDHAALLREMPVTLVDLLERIPGVAVFRAGMFVQPEAAAAFGGTAGRMEIELDGYSLDPLTGSTTDLSRIPIGQLREVRVERRLDVLRIRLLTEQPTIGQPASRVEAGIGQPAADLFRGIFLAPHVIVGPLGAGVERLDTDGFQRREPASVFNGWAKWGWTSERRGLQLEVIRTTLRREPDSPWPIDRVRQDLVLRGRNVFLPGLLGEAYVGRASLREEPFEAADTEDVIALERATVQAGARLVYSSPFGTITGALRYRDLAALPQTEAQLDARFAVGPAAFGGAVTSFNWKSGEATAGYQLHGRVGVPLAAVFGEVTGGRRGAPNYREADEPVLTERTGWRLGARLALGQRATGSIALVNLEQDPGLPFGLPFDSAAVPNATEPARGIEAFGRLVLWPGWFALEGGATYWTRWDGWTYLPARAGRAALELHTLPLPSGNLEILGRLEAAYRSAMLAYGAAPTDPQLVVLPRYWLVDGYLQIRIIDVRMFLRYEDLLGNQIEELPGRIHRGPRLMYGVKWNLWN